MKLKIPLPQCDEELELLTQWYFGKPLHLKTMSENCYEILEDYNSYHGDGFQFSESCTRGYDHSADFWAVVFGPLYCGGIGRASYGQFKANGWRQKRRISKWLKRRSERRSSTPRRAFVRLAAQSSGAERTDRSATRSVLMRGRVDAVRRASFPIALFLILILSGCGMDLIRWRGAVASAIRGKRGQALLKELEVALLNLPEKRLVAREFANPFEGEVSK